MLKTSSDGSTVGESRETDWSKKTAECVEQQETSLGRESQKPQICRLIGSLMVCVINGVTTSSPPPLQTFIFTHPPTPTLSSAAASVFILSLKDTISSPTAEDSASA